jgi:hypothetical protein
VRCISRLRNQVAGRTEWQHAHDDHDDDVDPAARADHDDLLDHDLGGAGQPGAALYNIHSAA